MTVHLSEADEQDPATGDSASIRALIARARAPASAKESRSTPRRGVAARQRRRSTFCGDPGRSVEQEREALGLAADSPTASD